MSSDKKIIAVVGSTGTQGGSVVRSLLADGTFSVRALTRKVDGEAAQKLKAAGVEVVAADLEDVESLKKAFKGAYGVFGVTGEGSSRIGVSITLNLVHFVCQTVRMNHLNPEMTVIDLWTASSLGPVSWRRSLRSSKESRS